MKTRGNQMGNKVLVIEDSPDNMKLICYILKGG